MALALPTECFTYFGKSLKTLDHNNFEQRTSLASSSHVVFFFREVMLKYSIMIYIRSLGFYLQRLVSRHRCASWVFKSHIQECIFYYFSTIRPSALYRGPADQGITLETSASQTGYGFGYPQPDKYIKYTIAKYFTCPPTNPNCLFRNWWLFHSVTIQAFNINTSMNFC